MAFDYKKEFKEFYAPTTSPAILTVPPMRFVAVRGSGDPNAEEGQYAQATQLLYGISYTIKMSKKSKDPADHIDGYHDYVVPPLEGLWWMQDGRGCVVDFSHKDRFEWISMIRLPEFVTDDVFARAKATFGAKHPEVDTELAYLFDFDEGAVAQVLHKGPYDGEPATVAALDAFINAQGHQLDFAEDRHHHEIYLGDPRRSKQENLRTIIRHPVIPAAIL